MDFAFCTTLKPILNISSAAVNGLESDRYHAFFIHKSIVNCTVLAKIIPTEKLPTHQRIGAWMFVSYKTLFPLKWESGMLYLMSPRLDCRV
jgi:hypothetical protein